MICLDSTFLIDFLRNEPYAVNKIKSIEEELSTTDINIFEVMLGINLQKEKSKERLEKFEEFISHLTILPFNTSASKKSAQITADLIKKVKIIENLDCLIAGTMLSNNCNSILTRNIEHFGRISELKVIKY